MKGSERGRTACCWKPEAHGHLSLGLAPRQRQRHADPLLAVRVDLEEGRLALSVQLALPPLALEPELLLAAHVLRDEHRQARRLLGLALLLERLGLALSFLRGLLRAEESVAVCRSLEKRLSGGTHLGLLLSSFPTLVLEARLDAADRVDVPLGDVGGGLRAQVVAHLVAESRRGGALQGRELSAWRQVRRS